MTQPQTTVLGLFAQYASDAGTRLFRTVRSREQEALFGAEEVRLLESADPFSHVRSALDCGAQDGTETRAEVASVFTDESALLSALPHLYALTDQPVVVNVKLALPDYSVIPALKDLDWDVYVSGDAESLCANLPAAYRRARENRSVLHFHDARNLPLDLTLPTTSDLEPKCFRVINRNANTASTLIINFSTYTKELVSQLTDDAILAVPQVYRPWSLEDLWSQIPSTVSRILILQNKAQRDDHITFEPLVLDFFEDFNKLIQKQINQIILTNIGEVKSNFEYIYSQLISNLDSQDPDQNLYLGDPISENRFVSENADKVVRLEQAYVKVLRNIVNNLTLLNEYDPEATKVDLNSPEYGFGKYLRWTKSRKELIEAVKKSLDVSLYDPNFGHSLVSNLSRWVELHDFKSFDEVAKQEFDDLSHKIISQLEASTNSTPTTRELLNLAPTIHSWEYPSHWLIGSDAWSYDLGSSGVHQVLASGENVNVLLIDSEPYNKENLQSSIERKKDVGLYAMNFHNVYVASVAIYSSYTQLLSAILEAAQFKGPSIVLAYLPYHSENDNPLDILKETKNAVESGYWPLYRYDPSREHKGKEPFKLDSSVIRRNLQTFLDRENKLTLLFKSIPNISLNIVGDESDIIARKQNNKSKKALEQLLEGLSGPPLHIYYASDGGNASSLANRLAMRASARGLKAVSLSMDDIDLEELPGEENVVFITSTAGQGEFPQDGKSFWDALKNSTDLELSNLNFAVFGLGDSAYWPRKEDSHYYNKPSQDLFKKMEFFSAKPMTDIGLGDDQDADGYQTAYSEWEPQIWEFMGVSGAALPDEPKPMTNEDIKETSNYLRGSIAENLLDESSGTVTNYNEQLMKFHGIYTQQDRDVTESRKAQGLEPYYCFMARARLPGGMTTPKQWLGLDKLADTSGFGTLKLTTRATFQIHGVLKKNLKHVLRGMNAVLIDTLAAAGDVNRNVMVSALPGNAKVHKQVAEMGKRISDHFLPQTTAYHEVWLEGPEDQDESEEWRKVFETRPDGPKRKKIMVEGNALVDREPIYGRTYLPRKFKFNITVPPFNDVDVWAVDVGLIAIVNQETQIVEGYNVYVGGGMGTTHNNKKTYPRTGSSFGFVKTEDLLKALEGIVIIQRDFGDRENRKHARVKYTVDTLGIDVYKSKVEEYWGQKFEAERPYEITSNIDYFGWIKDETGLNHFTAFIENGRVEDTPDLPQKTGLRKIAEFMLETGSGHFRLTGNQHLVISNIRDDQIEKIKLIMKEYKLDNLNFSGLRLSSSSCVGLPTCGLAFAESERFLPDVITQLEETLESLGLRHDSIIMRMTGCPNGCSRPWLGELALVGKAPRIYNMYLGGGWHGHRLNKLYRSNVKDDEIVDVIKPLLRKYAMEREDGEHFGDFVLRAGIVKPTLEGKFFHDDVLEDAL